MVKIRKGPLGEMDVLHRRMERMMENVLQRHGASSAPAQWNPAADLYETRDQVVVILEVSGVDSDSLEVTLEGTVLRVQGRRGGPPPRKDCVALLQMEIEYGPFDRLFTVPANLDGDTAHARLDDGFLEIQIPKRAVEPEEEDPGRVEIETA